MTAKKKKTLAAIGTVALALVIALGGTFAWQSISQQALNEAAATLNPGGRLHDDFNGQNKDIYVENFTDPEDGSPIFARVRLYAGTGSVKINGRDIDDYFGLDTLKLIVRQPLHLTGTEEKFDIECRVSGGGVTGQADAIRHGISRALLQYDTENLRPLLKKAGYLTRDPRMTERKKYGLTGARRAPQFSKR